MMVKLDRVTVWFLFGSEFDACAIGVEGNVAVIHEE
jgi:hypothetical protein